ncbi:hypothetical protein BABA_21246 [Neobacillus bataviensis LMG 21833]|uniref:Integral membrane protein n=1 Tax=Neobacillus bataviensis LMG 21833 TaxID=1117379 RepID=K6CYA7_9BACI|nr:DUF624 domain-containing protein [Neobacillus bataviensis]EKN65212.1 hypothetical protein BABA_21246 [Neobacillus bataviensis LMG 21833]
MNESKGLQFFDGKLFKVMNYLYWMFMSSALFLVSNILLVFSLYAVVVASQDIPFSIYHVIWIGIVAVPLGPSLAGMYTVMNKLVQTQEVSVINDYFKGYRQHFKQSITVSSILFLFYILAVVNYAIIQQSETMGFLLLPLLIVLSLLMCISLYAFPFVSLKKSKTKEIFKLSLYFSIKEFKLTFMMLVAAAIFVYLMLLIPTITLFLLPGIYCFVSSFLLKNVYDKIV